MFGSVQQLDVEEAYQFFAKQEANSFFVDVREEDEWEDGTIPGAIKISLGEIEEKLAEFKPDCQYILVCRSGVRSNIAASILLENGFNSVFNLQGGMFSWEDKNYPIS